MNNNNPLITVITPTTGSDYLMINISSVRKQTYKHIQHLIVADGRKVNIKHADLIHLPYPTGLDRYNGHKIYGAMTYIAKGDYITFLDEDNYYDPTHIESLVDVIGDNEWAYSFRKIVDKNGNHLTDDNCESIGDFPNVFQENFIDVGCFFMSKHIALEVSPLWYRQAREPGIEEVDRVLSKYLIQVPHTTTYKHTLNYRAGNTALSVKPEFFYWGNEQMKGSQPWLKI